MIGADHKLAGVRHDLVAVSGFVSRKHWTRAIAMLALSIRVYTIFLIAL